MISLNLQVNTNLIQSKVNQLINDNTMTQIHETYREYINKFAPKKDNNLVNNSYASSDGVHYPSPYAHYQYEGIVYVPNFPTMKDDGKTVTGWLSPKGVKKSPNSSGRMLGTEGEYLKWKFGYTTSNTGHHWDKLAMQKDLNSFIDDVQDILRTEARKYGYN